MVKRICAAALCVLVLVLLASCASIPLSTMWRMRDFTASDLAGVQPRDVRLAGRMDPAPLRIDAARSELVLTLTPRDERARDERYVFGLRETKVYDPRLLAERNAPRWQVFELDDKGLAAWNALRPKVADAEQRYRAMSFNFSFRNLGDFPQGIDEVVLSATLQLGLDQEPLVLTDGLRIKMGH